MKTRYFGVVLAGLLALAVAGSAMALDGNYTGALRHGADFGLYQPTGGMLLGHVSDNNTWPYTGRTAGILTGQFGMEFAGQTVVSSFTINQAAGPTINTLDVYANGQKIGVLTMPSSAAGTQTVDFADCLLSLDGKTYVQSVTATWLTFVYTGSNPVGTNNNVGIISYSLGGQAFSGQATNPNINWKIGADKITVTNPFGPTQGSTTSWYQGSGVGVGGEANRAALTDGVVSNEQVINNGTFVAKMGVYFLSDNRNNGKSVTISYGGETRTVASVGLAFTQDEYQSFGWGGLNAPVWVEIVDSHGNKVKVDLNPALSQYGRYDLLASNLTIVDSDFLRIEKGFVSFLETESLTILFPNDNRQGGQNGGQANDTNQTNANYFGGYNAFCFAEFQAFSFRQDAPIVTLVPVPEPATMSLLVLGGLALLRRKRV